jgi:F420-0:gamma-glutamyl ligase
LLRPSASIWALERGNDVDVADALVVVGERSEQTPLVVIGDLPFVTFQERDPSPEELRGQWIDVEDDLYAPLLQGVEWHKGLQCG